MNFNESLNYIHSLLKFGIHPGLDRVGTLLQILGNPQKNLKCVHVAGTNGKGSVSTAISNVLRKSGKNVGLYTSPYVTDFLERIQFNNKPIKKELFAECVTLIKPQIEKLESQGIVITEFEALTATMFLCFSSLDVDIAVLEVGLGGRLDATNVIDTPLVNVITSLSLDHTAILGDTIEKITFEKCGTIKENGTLVCSLNQSENALKVIKEQVNLKNNTLILPDKNSLSITEKSVLGTHFNYKGENYFIKMLGEHQILNMTAVIEAVNVLIQKGFNITTQNIKDGISETVLPARVEVVSQKPLVILDGGHNEDGAKAFFNSVKDVLVEKKGKLVVVGGMMKDKAVENSLSPLLKYTDIFYAVTPENPRSMNANELASIARKYCGEVIKFENPVEAVLSAKEKLNENDILFVVGSLYLAGEVRERLCSAF